jgi:hypothetical protein
MENGGLGEGEKTLFLCPFFFGCCSLEKEEQSSSIEHRTIRKKKQGQEPTNATADDGPNTLRSGPTPKARRNQLAVRPPNPVVLAHRQRDTQNGPAGHGWSGCGVWRACDGVVTEDETPNVKFGPSLMFIDRRVAAVQISESILWFATERSVSSNMPLIQLSMTPAVSVCAKSK